MSSKLSVTVEKLLVVDARQQPTHHRLLSDAVIGKVGVIDFDRQGTQREQLLVGDRPVCAIGHGLSEGRTRDRGEGELSNRRVLAGAACLHPIGLNLRAGLSDPVQQSVSMKTSDLLSELSVGNSTGELHRAIICPTDTGRHRVSKLGPPRHRHDRLSEPWACG
ncbi:hypothetical protein [Nocardia sp. N2S4-5]|uniref:hypothetical protein n=1 Tax=Nocardia sp. N2S4-5 TaxID=3351565 RepID=UPI0037D24070